MIVDALVEGLLDEAVAIRLIAYCQHQFGTAYGKRATMLKVKREVVEN